MIIVQTAVGQGQWDEIADSAAGSRCIRINLAALDTPLGVTAAIDKEGAAGSISHVIVELAILDDKTADVRRQVHIRSGSLAYATGHGCIPAHDDIIYRE